MVRYQSGCNPRLELEKITHYFLSAMSVLWCLVSNKHSLELSSIVLVVFFVLRQDLRIGLLDQRLSLRGTT